MIVSNLLIVTMLYAGGGAVAPDCDENPTEVSDHLAQQGIATDNDSLLREVVEEPRPVMRSIIADLLTRRNEPRTAPLLRARLAVESDDDARAHFARDILVLEGRGALDLARSTLGTLKDLEARMWLAWALAESGDLSGYPDVLAGLKLASSRAHHAGSTHLLAAQELVAFVKACRGCDLDPQPLDVALGLVDDPSVAVRLAAAIAVAERLGDDPRSEVALRRMAAQEGEDYGLVQRYAAASLHLWSLKMKGKDAGGHQ
jgi:hypothetical protein